ncbi:pantoate--beta-alanine ligase [Olivibacter sp. XZL3]|uniref:pantoate--beta-alanine ligase n=1 Tax=Olivibacter sp. XZL3 TaxID=1735116 RepID=UPI00106562E8|nr:pantoate--beta-alanine ligase [Olivibacter sp. XZL3]
METFTTKNALEAHLSAFRSAGKTIGFVPTMGALHEGHLALIERAKSTTSISVCSIFVNPTQFNDPADLEKYPRPIEKDIALLEAAGCDVLFLPTVGEMYPSDEEAWSFDLGQLDKIWEGAKRPGHYQGVTQIVNKLFHIVKPNIAFFGQKDFQQCMVIQLMVDKLALPVRLEIVDTIRDADGLAKSSRNVRLSPRARTQALALSKALFMVKQAVEQGESPQQAKEEALRFLQQAKGVELEYFAVCNPRDLTEIGPEQQNIRPLVVILAAWVGGVRLIDNILL